jgi:hypothetical protein
VFLLVSREQGYQHKRLVKFFSSAGYEKAKLQTAVP